MAIPFANAGEYQQALEHADAIRTSNISQFSQELDQLAPHKDEFSAEEKAFYLFLSFYLKALHGQFQEAVNGYKNLIDDTPPKVIEIRARTSLVNIYSFVQNWQDGLSQLSVLLSQLNTINDQNVKEQIIGIAAIFYNSLGQYQLGMDYTQQYKSLSSSPRSQCAAAQLEVEASFGLSTVTSDSDLFAHNREICQQAGEMVMVGLIDSFKIRSLIKERQFNAAMTSLQQQLSTIENTRYAPLMGLYYSLIAKVAVTLQRWSEVKNYADKALATLDQPKSYQPFVRVYKALYEYYLHQNGTSSALEAYKKYAEADKAYLDDIKAKNLAFQIAQHQSIEQQNRIELLDKQNKLLTLQQQLTENESRARRDMLIALFCVSAMLLVGIMQARRSQRRLRLLAERDGLTDVFNRRHFTALADKLLKQAGSQQQTVSCIMFDLDNFKQLNDSQGHSAGDIALKQVAAVAKQHCRPQDIIGRIGGEEFCIILPNTSQQQALDVAERLRACFEAISDAALGDNHTITASFGISETQLSGYALEGLMHDTDQAMYSAKTEGRNRVVLFFEQLRLTLSPQPQPS
ncbi:GGDEF domain-containing protein [Shewanella mangrovi]|uniref:GGDEF domain-containing protein n=1 Tax=Shewanella mangrovi TaxID=1515746 RepID=UPI00068C1154|nr:GGDEF domain-containing protein [Shewanella mangrovi]